MTVRNLISAFALIVCVTLLGGCASPRETSPATSLPQSERRPVVVGQDDQVGVRGMSARIPPAAGWTRRDAPMPKGGTLVEFERDLPGGNRGQIHITDYFGPSAILPLELSMSGHDDATRLAWFISFFESAPRSEVVRHFEWVDMQRRPQSRFNAVCREKHELREDYDQSGTLHLWQDWMLFCLDPASHVPVQIDYAERFPGEGGSPSPTFSKDAEEFFDGIVFREGSLGDRPSAEVVAAFVQVNDHLFSAVDHKDYPATVVFSLDQDVKGAGLQQLAQRLFRLKNTSPSAPLESVIARRLTEEKAVPTRFEIVPATLSRGGAFYLGDVLIHRQLLPKGHLGKSSGYGAFLLRLKVYPATAHHYVLEHVGVEWLK